MPKISVFISWVIYIANAKPPEGYLKKHNSSVQRIRKKNPKKKVEDAGFSQNYGKRILYA